MNDDAREDARQLRLHAAGLTYNDTTAEGEAKHRLHEIAMRIETGYYPSRPAAAPLSSDARSDEPGPAGDGVLPGDIAAYSNFIEQAGYRKREPSRWEIWMAALDYEREAPRSTPAGLCPGCANKDCICGGYPNRAPAGLTDAEIDLIATRYATMTQHGWLFRTEGILRDFVDECLNTGKPTEPK